jgi:pimeloyl-ACP methyl ester carboxylesterase
VSAPRPRARVRHFAATHDGWELEVWRHAPKSDAGRRAVPVLIVPGYAQTPYLFGVHPRGPSLLESLVTAGFETWTVYLRGTGQSRPGSAGARPPSLTAYVEEDLPAALGLVLERGETGAERAFLLGSSLGGSLVYAHLARAGTAGVAGVVTLGAPLRWTSPHPLVRALFASPQLAERLPAAGLGRWATHLLPRLGRWGWLGLYVNPANINPDDDRLLVGAITDPSPAVNLEIADWLARGSLDVAGVDVARSLGDVTVPLLVVAANRDGLVPPESARSAAEAWGGEDVELLEVGTRDDWFSHADLFVAPTAPERVFAPVARWLAARAPWGVPVG